MLAFGRRRVPVKGVLRNFLHHIGINMPPIWLPVVAEASAFHIASGTPRSGGLREGGPLGTDGGLGLG